MLRQFPLGERSQQKLSSPPNQRLTRLIQQIERGRTTGQYTYTRHLIDYQLQYAAYLGNILSLINCQQIDSLKQMTIISHSPPLQQSQGVVVFPIEQ